MTAPVADEMRVDGEEDAVLGEETTVEGVAGEEAMVKDEGK